MAISKANFNSFNVTPTASKFITFNSSNNGLAADDVGGALKLISTQTASGSSTISFTSGIDSTYKEYIFKYYNVHPSTGASLYMNLSADGGSNYNITKTSSAFRAFHQEDAGDASLTYLTGYDLAQGTGSQRISGAINASNADESCSGTLHLFDPSNTTFVKHFLSVTNTYGESVYSHQLFIAGYGNTTSAINAVQFSLNTGNIDSGTFKLYGVN